MFESNSKVTASHLKREAFLYVRQSTMRQLFENTESTQRQYSLRQRALALGWTVEQLQIIDSDQGQSGASAADREGFQKLVAEVSLGRAGIVMGLEVSRLARNNADWHRLLEICALSDTLILDEDGLYNPNDFNDRLLLGLKGAMSEAELHLLRARLRGGMLNKARRGEYACRLPIGFVYDEQKQVQLDPDQQVRDTITLMFATYRRTGSAAATTKYFKKQRIPFPRRSNHGLKKGVLSWGQLRHSRTIDMLHNPRYAGVYCFGRAQVIRKANGKYARPEKPRDQWHALIPDAHAGYISWEEYEDNQRRLLESAQAYRMNFRQSTPREGPALLQGIAICGVCGKRMSARYQILNDQILPHYLCTHDYLEYGGSVCQRIQGAGIDKAIGELLLEMFKPMALEVALAVQQELTTRLEEADRLRSEQVERVRYEADLARQRYMSVDFNNRLVADTLEAEWNEKLRALQEAQENYQHQRQQDTIQLDEEIHSRVKALSTDFPRLWNDPNTSNRDRKRMVRLLLEDVTLIKKEQIIVNIRFKGGTVTTMKLPAPKTVQEKYTTPPEIVEQIDRLIEYHTDKQIANILNEQGLRSGRWQRFNRSIIGRIRRGYGLKSRYDRLRKAGMLTKEEMAKQLGVCNQTVLDWRAAGLLKGHPYNDQYQCLFEPPGDDPPVKTMGSKLSKRRRFPKVVSNKTIKEQYEA